MDKVFVPTRSFGKWKNEQWLREHSIPNTDSTMYMVGLLGNPYNGSIQWHLDHWSLMGYCDRKRLLIYEWDYPTYQAIHRCVGHYGIPKDNVRLGNIASAIDEITEPVGFFDIDGTTLFHQWQLEMLLKLMERGVPTIHDICTNRGGKFLRTQSYPYSVPRVWCPIRKRLVIPQQEKIRYLLKLYPATKRYHINITPYCGKGSTEYDQRGAQMLSISLQLRERYLKESP